MLSKYSSSASNYSEITFGHFDVKSETRGLRQLYLTQLSKGWEAIHSKTMNQTCLIGLLHTTSSLWIESFLRRTKLVESAHI